MMSEVWADPLSNGILRAVPDAEFSRVCGQLDHAPLSVGTVLNNPLRGSCHAYFPISGAIALIGRTDRGTSCGTAIIGNEGVVGTCLVMDNDASALESVVVQPGYAFRLQLDSLRAEFARGGWFSMLLLRYAKTLIFQIAQAAVCNGQHSADQRLSKWLLFIRDRTMSNELELTQQFLGTILGTRREEVTLAAGRLQDAGLIENRRGRVVLLDKDRLAASCCECYALERSAVGRLRATRFQT